VPNAARPSVAWHDSWPANEHESDDQRQDNDGLNTEFDLRTAKRSLGPAAYEA